MAKVEKAGLAAHRQELLSRAAGDVLEIGAGTGLNLGHYGTSGRSLTLTEPERPMLRRLQQQVQELAPPAMVLRAPAEDLPFEDDSFDVAVSTSCSAASATSRARSASCTASSGPAVELLFIEHVRSDDARLARRQDRMNGAEPLPRRLRVQPSDARLDRGPPASTSSTSNTPRCPRRPPSSDRSSSEPRRRSPGERFHGAAATAT